VPLRAADRLSRAMKKALVLGGSGQLGIAVAEQLVDAEWRVFTAARSGRAPPPDLTRRGVVALDSPSGPVSEVLRSSGAVYDAVFVPTAYSAKDASDLLRVKGRFNSLVVVSSASVYADEHGRSLDEAAEGGFPDFEGAIGEDTRTVEPGDATYSTRKVAMERELLDDGLPVSILRPCAIYGKFARHPREWWVVKRVLDRRASIPVAYNADSLFHTSSVRSIATLAQICMEHPATRMLTSPTLRRFPYGRLPRR